mmetsp:Transcript_15395/g.28773  ORF Transcript_15395/g.28773 Transcript_15395/m.28773 type:complete len:202 (-) Transcript_15395:820-1425(-)
MAQASPFYVRNFEVLNLGTTLNQTIKNSLVLFDDRRARIFKPLVPYTDHYVREIRRGRFVLQQCAQVGLGHAIHPAVVHFAEEVGLDIQVPRHDCVSQNGVANRFSEDARFDHCRGQVARERDSSVPGGYPVNATQRSGSPDAAPAVVANGNRANSQRHRNGRPSTGPSGIVPAIVRIEGTLGMHRVPNWSDAPLSHGRRG